MQSHGGRLCTKSENSTNGSWWISSGGVYRTCSWPRCNPNPRQWVDIQIASKKGLERSTHCRGWNSEIVIKHVRVEKISNDPPTAVGGIRRLSLARSSRKDL